MTENKTSNINQHHVQIVSEICLCVFLCMCVWKGC